MNTLKNEEGFTLVELVLVIVVLGILASVAMVQFGTITDDAKKSAIDGAFGPYNAQLALAVNKNKKLPHDDADGTANSFKIEVYDATILAGGNVKTKFVNTNLCNNPNCDWRIYVDDNNNGACDAGEWHGDFRYQEATGAITVLAAKTNAGAC